MAGFSAGTADSPLVPGWAPEKWHTGSAIERTPTVTGSGVYHSRLSSRWERYVSVIDCYRRPRTLCVVRALCKVGNRNEVAGLFAHPAISQ